MRYVPLLLVMMANSVWADSLAIGQNSRGCLLGVNLGS